MNRDEVIRMAREAGICMESSILLPAPDGEIKALERFAALVAAAEREACAKVCEEYDTARQDNYACLCAAAIRARGEVKP